MKKILIISRGAWSDNNAIGNTLSNLFSDVKTFEMHNVYMRSELPGKTPCHSIYQINEFGLIRSLKTLSNTGGVLDSQQSLSEVTIEEKLYTAYQNKNLYSLWIVRDILWILGKWRHNLRQYINEIKPDLIFMPVFGCVYAHRVLNVIKKESNAKVVLFHADDHYSLNQKNFSPLFWLYRFWLRRWIRRSVRFSHVNFCISDIQILDYNKYFGVNCKLLQKFHDFSGPRPDYSIEPPIKIVFTGSMECGRWKSLAKIADAVDSLNSDTEQRCTFAIYSGTKLTSSQVLLFQNKKGVILKGFVSSVYIKEIQTSADILVHVESFDADDKLRVRQSFSTKIVDYLSRGRCILAVGPTDIASIQYFEKYKSAYVITNPSEVYKKLSELISDYSLMETYADKAWSCGYANNGYHKREEFLELLSSL